MRKGLKTTKAIVLVIAVILTIFIAQATTPLLGQTTGFQIFFPTLTPIDYLALGDKKMFVTPRGVINESGKEIPTAVLFIPHMQSSPSDTLLITPTLTLKKLPNITTIHPPGVPLLISSKGNWILIDSASGTMLWNPKDNSSIRVNVSQPILTLWEGQSATPLIVTTGGIHRISGELLFTASSAITGIDARENLVLWSTKGYIWMVDAKNQKHMWHIGSITDAGACNPPIALTSSGSLYALNSTPTWLATLPPNSYILGCYAVTPLGTFSAAGGSLKRYSSWLKSVKIKFISTLNGEVVMVPTQEKPIISTEDLSFLTGKPTRYTHDSNILQPGPNGISINGKILIPIPATAACQNGEDLVYADTSDKLHGANWQTPLPLHPLFLACSPTQWAAVGTTKTVIGNMETGEIFAIIPTPKDSHEFYYGQGYIWISTPEGVFRLPIYEKRVELIIGSTLVRINGKTQYIDVAPRILPPGRTFVPLRFVSESMGANVIWHGDTRTIDISLDNYMINLKIGSKTATVNGTAKQLDAAPFIDPKSNRTLVPIRFVAEFLGSKVYWLGRLRKVVIVK